MRWSGAAASRLWRQIADRIRLAIGSGEFAGTQLPPEMALAARFGVNRHTVRGAIAALVQEGVLRAEQGRGTFIERTQALRLSDRRENPVFGRAGGPGDAIGGACCLPISVEPADARTAEALELDPGRDRHPARRR